MGNAENGLTAHVILRQMSEAIRSRGPDDQGNWFDSSCGVGLAHRRLSVVELSPAGHQPMMSDNKRFVMVFNGEIYNHAVLRSALIADGFRPQWRGNSDTETLLAGFETWGIPDTLKRSVGMFAIAVLDRTHNQLTLARDRVGEKPLYYGWQNGHFLFGSELKSLEQHPSFSHVVDRDALTLYLQHGYVPAPWSIYRNVFKLQPATLLTVTAGGNDVQSQRYWNASEFPRSPLANATPAEAASELERLLLEAVQLQMGADVPVGAFLSGGVDSSTVVAMMQANSTHRVRTYSVGFDAPDFNEAGFAAAVASHLGTDHTQWILSGQDAVSEVSQLSQVFDEPFADSSQLPMALVCRLARQDVTVALSGDGGDELFNGYERYAIAAQLNRSFSRLPAWFNNTVGWAIEAIPSDLLQLTGRLAQQLAPARMRSQDMAGRLQRVAALLQQRGLRRVYLSLISCNQAPEQLLKDFAQVTSPLSHVDWGPEDSDPFSRMAFLDFQTYLPDDILVKNDRAAMAVSLEGRMPLLDHRVVEFALSLPASLKVRGNTPKWLLRQVLYRYVPERLIERPKKGFAIPLQEWLRGPLRDWAEMLLLSPPLASIVNARRVGDMWQRHLSGKSDFGHQLWTLIMLQAWLADRPRARFG